MQVQYKTYESYKDSGVPWLGMIPKEWPLEKAKWIHKYKKVLNRKNECENVLSLTLRGVVNNNPDSPEGLVPEDYRTYQLFEKDDLVFKLIDLENYKTSRVGLVHEDGIMSSAYIRVRPSHETNARFLYYFYFYMYLEGVYNKLGAGVRSTLNQNDLLDLPVPIIDRSTQDRIVAFLDQKTAEIDTAIEKKQRLIELLKEQKAILINQAVTKGLNPDAPMKDSGIEWIGRIPAHWEVKKAKYLFREIDERSINGDEELLSVSHMTGVTPRSEKNIYMFMAEDYSGSKLCHRGDLVFNIMWAWMGALGVSDRTGIVSPSYGVYRPKKADTFNNWYLEELLRSLSYVTEYNKRSTGLHSSRLRLYSHMFFAMEIAVPPLEEQNKIKEALSIQCKAADNVIIAGEKEIEKLQEFKQTLIAHAVTGKIKV
jgi:type I restriction enzyme, S subunit